MEQSANQETVDAIKLMIVGSMLAEYGARLMIDDTKHDLKQRIREVINSVAKVERHFITHPNSNKEYREQFRRAFNKNETVLLADLNLTCWQISEEGLEEIVNAVKKAIIEQP